MADSNHLSARTEDLVDDDPFAELTRIMGQGSVVRPRSEDDSAQSFSLDLDLEKELLGDLGSEEETTPGFSEKGGSQFNVAEAFGEKSGDDLFKGTGLEDFESDLESDPIFAREEEAAFDLGPSSEDLAGSIDSALSDADWSLSSSRPEPLFGSSFGSAKTDDEPFSFEPEAQPAAETDADALDLSDSMFAPRQDANVLSPRVDDFLGGHFNDEAAPSHEPEPSFDDLMDDVELEADHAEPAAQSDPFDVALSSELFAKAFQDHAPASQPADAGRSIEDELASALNFDWGSETTTQTPDNEPAWAEADFVQPQEPVQPEWESTPAAEEQDWTAELSDDFAAEQSGQVDTSWMDSQENWNEPAPSHDWTIDPASLRNTEQAAAAPVHSYADYEQSLPQGSVQDEQSWSQQDESYQWESNAAEGDSFDGAPDIETIEIPEKAVAVTEDLDLPHVPYHEDVKPAAQLDDIEELLSGAFGSLDQPSQEEEEWSKPDSAQPAQADEADNSEFDEFFSADLAAASAAALARNGYGQTPQLSNEWDSPLGYEQAARPVPGTPPPAPSREGLFSRRGIRIAALLAGVAVIGVGGVLAYNFMGDGSGETVLIKADNSPLKEKPENPGGPTIPNQESQVYRQVAGETSGTPAGESQLISGAEEPVELPSPNDDAGDDIGEMLAGEEGEEFSQELAAGEQASEAGETEAATKSEERLVSNDQQEQIASPGFATLTPRKVRSYIVRPDGTMVPREVEAPAANSAEPLPGVPNDRIEVAARTPAQQEEGLVPGQEVPPLNAGAAPANAPTNTDAAAGAPATTMPASAPIPAARPASAPRTAAAPAAQPVEAPAPTAPTQVAAAQPTAPQQTAAASGWSVQIASQPSLEAAQQSYQSMAQRYGTMLQGKGVNIVKAEVPGKGTYYRVRIPAASKNDAVALCERLKSQGGTCFVSQ